MKPLCRSSIRVAILFLLVSVLPALGAGARDGKRTDDQSLFSAAAYLDHVTHLASDELEGRGTAQEGNDKAANYIASIFQKDAVQPAGDDGTYFQNFTLKLRHRIGDSTNLAVGAKGRPNRRRLTLHTDFVPFPFSEAKSFAGDVVFAGFGIANDSLGYDDYDGLDVTDKVVLVLRGSPNFASFDADADTSFRGKATKANARDAVAILVVNSLIHHGDDANAAAPADEPSDKLYDFEQSSPGEFGFGRQNYGIPMLHITRAAAEKMLKAAGLPNLAALEREIEDGHKPISQPMKGVSVKGSVAIEPVETPVRNVVGMIRGSGANADEIIVLGAHYDHLGINNKGQPNFDSARDIFHGADDNASGTAMLMTMADAYTRGPGPNRSILLIAFTGEELGLLGSQNFVNHPTVDLKQCVAMLNFDMVGRLKDDRLEVGGMRTGGFEDMVQRLAPAYGLAVNDGGGGAGPSDHSSFYSKSIPVMFFFTGLHPQYHQATDTANLINSEGAMRIARLAADCIDEIDANSQRPQFTADPRAFTLQVQDDAGRPGPRWMGRGPGRGRLRLGVMLKPGEEPGAVVDKVAKDSPAEKAGIKDEDRIVKIGQSRIKTARDLMTALRNLKKGEKAQVVVERSGVSITLEVQLGEQTKPAEAEQPFGEKGQALIALAKRMQETAPKSDAERSVSWTQDADSLSVLLRSSDPAEQAEIMNQAAKLLEALPNGGDFSIKCQFNVDFSTSGKQITELSVKLEKRKWPSGSDNKEPPSNGAVKSKDDAAQKTKAQDRPTEDRQPRAGRRKQAA